MPMTPLPTPPDPADPTTFSARANAFCNALLLFQTEANGLSATAVTLNGGTMTAPLGFAVGSVAAASGFRAGQGNTGFYFPTTTSLAFTFNGAQCLLSDGPTGLTVKSTGLSGFIKSDMSSNGNATAYLQSSANVAQAFLTAVGSTTGGTYLGLNNANLVSLEASGSDAFLLSVTGNKQMYFATNSVICARFDGAGELLIGGTAFADQGAFLLQVNSQIWATNATISTSDAKTKDELPIPDRMAMLKRVSDIPTRFYIRNDEGRAADGSRFGYFAQDFEAIFGLETGIVRRLKSGLLALDEGAAHSVKIMALEERMAALEGIVSCQ